MTKVGPAGSALTYSTYVGGNSWDEGLGIAVDGEGNAYFTGNVQSPNYPVTAGAVGGTLKGWVGAAATKLDPSGSALVYSGVIGGSDWDEGDALAVDSTGAAYIAGHQASADFPTTLGALDTTSGGGIDGFLVKVDQTGTRLLYSTFIGGNGWDGAMAMSVGDGGRAYLTGATTSTDFPSTRSVGVRGGFDVFATTVDTEATAPPPPPPPPHSSASASAGDVRAQRPPDVPCCCRRRVDDLHRRCNQGRDRARSLACDCRASGECHRDLRSLGRFDDDHDRDLERDSPGGYELRIVGRGGDVERTATVRLDVHCCFPPG